MTDEAVMVTALVIAIVMIFGSIVAVTARGVSNIAEEVKDIQAIQNSRPIRGTVITNGTPNLELEYWKRKTAKAFIIAMLCYIPAFLSIFLGPVAFMFALAGVTRYAFSTYKLYVIAQAATSVSEIPI